MGEDEVKAYKKKCVGFVNFVKEKFDDFMFFGADMSKVTTDQFSLAYGINEDTDDYDNISIYMLKDALVEEKC